MYNGGELAYFVLLFAGSGWMYYKTFKNRAKYKEDKDKIKVVDLCTDLIDMKPIVVENDFKPAKKELGNELAIVKSYQALIDKKGYEFLDDVEVRNREDMLPDFLLFASAYMLKCYKYKREDLADKLMSKISFNEEEKKWIEYGLLNCIYENLKGKENKFYKNIASGDYSIRNADYISFTKQLNMVFIKTMAGKLDDDLVSEHELSKNSRWVKFLEAE